MSFFTKSWQFCFNVCQVVQSATGQKLCFLPSHRNWDVFHNIIDRVVDLWPTQLLLERKCIQNIKHGNVHFLFNEHEYLLKKLMWSLHQTWFLWLSECSILWWGQHRNFFVWKSISYYIGLSGATGLDAFTHELSQLRGWEFKVSQGNNHTFSQ